MTEQIPVGAYVIHELGHVGALPDADHLSGGEINTDDRRAHLIAGSHRLLGPRVDVLTAAKSRPQRRGAQVRAEDVDDVMHVRGVPLHKLQPALWRTKQTRGALDVAVRRAASGGPRGGESSVHGVEQWIKLEGSDKNLPVVERTILHRRPWPRRRLEMNWPKMRVACLPQDQRTLDGAKHVTLLSSAVGGECGARGERE